MNPLTIHFQSILDILLLVGFEGLGSDSHRLFSRFVRGSRQISPVSSLYYRESTDSLIMSRMWKTRSIYSCGKVLWVMCISSSTFFARSNWCSYVLYLSVPTVKYFSVWQDGHWDVGKWALAGYVFLCVLGSMLCNPHGLFPLRLPLYHWLY